MYYFLNGHYAKVSKHTENVMLLAFGPHHADALLLDFEDLIYLALSGHATPFRDPVDNMRVNVAIICFSYKLYPTDVFPMITSVFIWRALSR